MSIQQTPSADDRTLRQFTFVFLPALVGLIGFLALSWSGSWTLAATLWIAGGVVTFAAVLRAELRRGVFFAVMALTSPIGRLVLWVLVTITYFLVITPLGLLMRLLGRDALGVGPRAAASSYWRPRGPARPVAQYFREF